MPHSILMIDDSDEDRYLLKRLLKKSGLDTTIAEVDNGEQGLDFLINDEESKRKFPDIRAPLVVFLDINMPIMNGWEFLEEFREKHDQIWIKPTRVVMYSTSDEVGDIARVDKYSFVKAYVVKGSYTPLELRNTITTCFF